MTKVPRRTTQQVPPGYVWGRARGAGTGPVQLLGLRELQRFGVASGQTVTATATSLSTAITAIGGGNAPLMSGLVSGGAIFNTTGLTFSNSAATYYIYGVLYTAATQTVTLATADPSNPRIDIIAVDDTGTLIKVTGTASANPTAPVLDPSTQLALSFVLVAAGATSPTGTTTENIYKLGAAWTATTTGSTWNLSSGTDVPIGATSLEATNLTNGATVTFDRGSPETLGTGNLAFTIQSKATWANKRTLQFQFLTSAGVAVGKAPIVQSGAYGFDSSSTTTQQLVIIPLTDFAVPSTTQVQKLVITDHGGAIGFWINPIQIQTSTGTTGGGGADDDSALSLTLSTTLSTTTSVSVQVSSIIAGGAGITSTNKSASFTTTAAFNCYYLDTSGGAYTVTLDASPATNEVVEVWDSTGHAGANPVSFAGNGNNIAGAATVSNFIAINFGHARLVFNGTQWLAQ